MSSHFTVTMMSKIADFDCTLSGLPYADYLEARRAAPTFMAKSDAWLVIKITDEETEQVMYDGSEG